MITDKNKIELLAPAGGFASLKAAVVNGADAVYVGLEEFSARSKAANFDLQQLNSAVEYAHFFDVKVYVAMNTLLKDDEIQLALDLVKKADEVGVDAFIIQDLGFLIRFKEAFPNLTVHASTQMGVHNHWGALMAKDLGISRVILSRESTLQDIQKIKEALPEMEIETFVHGALCVSFSGNCYFSSLVSLNSGNRGKCLQLCRKKYELKSKSGVRSGYYLSPKDLCLINDIRQLITAGVISFKIEGRMRKPEYVGEAVRVYRKAIDLALAESNCDDAQSENSISLADINALKKMFNRGGYCKAHLNTHTENVIYPFAQNHIGLKVGVVKSVKAVTAYLSCELNQGDGIKFIRNNIEVGHALISKTGMSTTFVGEIKEGDDVHVTLDKQLIDKVNKRERKINIDCNVNILLGEVPSISCKIDEVELNHYGREIVQIADKRPVAQEQVMNALKYCDDIFDFKFNLNLDDNVFIPMSHLKELRRGLLDMIKNSLKNRLKTNQNSTMSDIISKISEKSISFFSDAKVLVQIDEKIQLPQSVTDRCDFVIFSPQIYSVDAVNRFVEEFKGKAVLSLPNIIRGADIQIIENIIKNCKIESVIVNNLFGLKLCEDKNILLGIFFNQLNDVVKLPKIMSIESESVSKNNFNYSYGYAPLMTLIHCVKKSLLGKCEPNCKGYDDYVLKDELKNEFKFRRFKVSNCYGQLLNGVPTYIKPDGNKVFLDFTMENHSNINELFNEMLSGNLKLEKLTRGNIGKILK